jgi:hypothetical protein
LEVEMTQKGLVIISAMLLFWLSSAQAQQSDITSVNAGPGPQGGAQSGAATLSSDPAQTQRRVTGSCPPGQAIRAINRRGTVECVTFPTPTEGGLSVVDAAGNRVGSLTEVFGGATVLAINADFFTLQVTVNRLDGSLESELWFESADCSGQPRVFRFAFEEPLVLPAALRGTELWAPQRPGAHTRCKNN